MRRIRYNRRFPGSPDAERQAPRRMVAVNGEVCSSALGHVPYDVVDISRMGCRIACRARMHTGDFIMVTLPTFAPLGARVAWWKEGCAGLEFGRPIGAAVLDYIVAEHPRSQGHEG